MRRIIQHIPLPALWGLLGCFTLGFAGWGWSFYHNYWMAAVPAFGSISYHIKVLQPLLYRHIGTGLGLLLVLAVTVLSLYVRLRTPERDSQKHHRTTSLRVRG